ncbi:ABC transporter ATP-binding protein [Streptomyces piniterrae]|uniref:ABC transporter ATP-binding protein n=1 Tax=Streptomyces piniterrae TaxID=2571125 RepID=A0A4U0NVK2_9ACTN|nr:ABC transporter ATP-binding protein [Streptomyces piniterrae]TJZ54274.1 ABC transporter ATP-binding protein [Streptomyces piniterrae]
MTGRAGGLLRSSLRRRRKEFTRFTGWSLLQAVPAFFSGWAVARAVDDGFLAGRTGAGFAWLGVLAGAIVIGAWATHHATLGLSALVEPLRDELVTLVTSGTLHRSAQVGTPADTAGVARLTEHVEIAREAYGAVVMFVQGFVVTSTGVLLGLATLDPVLLLFVLPPLLLGLGLFVGSLRALAARQRSVVLADERMAESVSALTGGLRDVVACGAEDVIRKQTGDPIDTTARATRALARTTALRTAALGIGGWLPLVLILAGAPWLVKGGVTAGAVLGAVTYVSQGLQPALQGLVQGVGGSGLWLLVTLGRIAEAAEGTPAEAAVRGRGMGQAKGSLTGAGAGLAAAGETSHRASTAARGSALASGASGASGTSRASRVELRGVTFRYARSAEPVISGLDLVLRPGEHLAVVGPSGAGKSTFAALVAGVLEPRAGQIRLDGVPVRSLDTDGLARHRVLIPQEAYVFAGTLWENLTYLEPGATTTAVDAAVDTVGARPLVERLGGYDAPVDHQELSAGERQLIALVRSYLPPAGLILLDEATCHLDPETEAGAEDAFARRPGTLIVCAHRISSALRADRILVLDGARADLGTHEELMAGSALYRDLVGHWEVTASPTP